MRDINQPEYLDDTDPEKNHDYWRQDHGGTITNHNGVADKLLKNDKLYNAMKGDWTRSDYNKSGNIKVTTGREDGKFYIQREQMNMKAVMTTTMMMTAVTAAITTSPAITMTTTTTTMTTTMTNRHNNQQMRH